MAYRPNVAGQDKHMQRSHLRTVVELVNTENDSWYNNSLMYHAER